MPAYLVRLIDTRDLVGFFFAEDADDLELIVDECTDIPDCEYVELPDGVPEAQAVHSFCRDCSGPILAHSSHVDPR